MIYNVVLDNYRHKYTFNPYILTFFHFSLYILFLPLLVPKPINAGHLSPWSTILSPN